MLWVGRAFLLNPIGLAIAAAAIAVYVLWKRWDDFKAWFFGAIDSVKKAFDVGFIDGIMEAIRQFNPTTLILKAFNAIIEYFFGINLGDIISNKLMAVRDTIVGYLLFVQKYWTDVWNSFKDAINNFFGFDIIGAGQEFFQKFVDGIKAAITVIGSAIKDAILALFPSAGEVWDKMKGFGQDLKDAASNRINADISSVKSLWGKVTGAASERASTLEQFRKAGEAYRTTGQTPGQAQVPAYADGGWINQPQVAQIGEAGQELVVPMTNRPRALDLLAQAAGRLGVGSGGATRGGGDTSIGGNTFTFSPSIQVSGGSSAADIQSAVERALEQARSQFEGWFKSMQYSQARTAMR
jgi:phage-related protein